MTSIIWANSKSRLLAIILVAAFVLFWKLGAKTLVDWDEALYAQISKEIVQGGDWFTLHWEFRPWLEKPPLFMWATAVFFHFFGISEFWARAASALSGLGVVTLTYLIGERVYSSLAGLYASVILLTSYHFVSAARFGTTDIMLTAFIYLAIYGYLCLKDGNPRWWHLVWFASALAVMVKGVAGLAAPAAIALALWLDGRAPGAVRSKYFWSGCLLAFIVVAPWHIAMYVSHGRAFVTDYFTYSIIGTVATDFDRTNAGYFSRYFYYFDRLIGGLFPWYLLVPVAAVFSTRGGPKRQADSRILWAICIVILGVYTILPTKFPHYLLPVYPALAVLLSPLVQQVSRVLAPRARIIMLCALLSIAVVRSGFWLMRISQRSESPMAHLARLAAATSSDDRDSLVLFSESRALFRPTALFYSNRPVQQAYAHNRSTRWGPDRYFFFENLADIVHDSPKRMIMRKTARELLPGDYEIRVTAESGDLLYVIIRRKN